jgi:hypothetical protein
MEREKAIMGYRFSEPFKVEPWQLEWRAELELKEKEKEEKRKKALKERRQSSFKPSVLFYVCGLFWGKGNNFLGLKLCLFLVFFSGLVNCVFCFSNVV